jgi:hypothetical protein
MGIMKNGLRLVALALAVVAFAPPSYADDIMSDILTVLNSDAVDQPTRGKARTTSADAARAAATRKCSTSGFKSAKEYNSSNIPWHTYSNCMVEHGQRP